MSDIGPQLRIHALYEKRAERDAARLKTYNRILKQVHSNIEHLTRTKPDTQRCIFVVPEFIPGGGPLIDVEDASAYIILRLNNDGLDVIYTRPNLLDISWAKHEAKYNRDMNPFASVLTATQIGEPMVTPAIAQVASVATTATAPVPPRAFDIGTSLVPAVPGPTGSTGQKEHVNKKPVNLRRVEDYVPARSFY